MKIEDGVEKPCESLALRLHDGLPVLADHSEISISVGLKGAEKSKVSILRSTRMTSTRSLLVVTHDPIAEGNISALPEDEEVLARAGLDRSSVSL